MKEIVYQKTSTREILVDDYYKNYHYVILSMGTHPCGYVEIPLGHKLHSINLSKLPDINCHGGITYARNYLCINSKNKETNYHGWWIGWDYAHSNDYIVRNNIKNVK